MTEVKNGQARIFKNDLLESLSKTTPTQSLLVYGPTIAGLLYVAVAVKGLSVLETASWFGFALLFWTFAEYFLHRYLFHYISEAKWTHRFHFVVHGQHHEYPRDPERLLMPPVPGMMLALILFSMFYLYFWIGGRPEVTWAFFPGFFLGYLFYSLMHYSIHCFKPPAFLKDLWIHHSVHHYQDSERAYGVSNRIWDFVFGTLPAKKN